MFKLHLRSTILLLLVFCWASILPAQSLLSGDIAGTITDPSGAVVPSAKVDLKSLDTGAAQSTTSNQNGDYRFSLLKPGRYSISVTQSGFQTAEHVTEVSVGKVAKLDFALAVGQASQTVEVAETVTLLNPEASTTTGFTPTEVQLLPSAGGDITNIAFTAPGVVVSVNNSYGNFSLNGLPGTSNLFTINGENNMDPYFNINNSGATNLTLGQNELQEATIVANPYNAQYGTFSGAQVIYTTKSGGNDFHGNAQYFWNGRYLNANNWFNNSFGDPRPFANANQWLGSVSGPIIKNRLFFLVDQEGLRFVLPNVDSVTIPTAAFANAVLANVKNAQPAEFPTYQQMMNLWLNAPGAANAQVIANSCSGLALAGFNNAQGCAARYQATPTALASEWILAFRVDYTISDKDSAFYRYRIDHGSQPTIIDPINPTAFNAISKQPQWDNQFQETHIFGPRSTNQFIASLSHYVAQFQQNASAANAALPFSVITSGVVPYTGLNYNYEFPQGRNITQYQFIDDFTIIRGAHSLKFGANFRRYDVSDHNFFFNSPAVYFGFTNNGLQNFANGLAYQYRQSLNLASDVPIALWGLGAYANDSWRIGQHLTLTLGLRIERNSNPVCQFNCFANFTGPWNTLASVTSPNPGNVPYSADILSGQHQAFSGVDGVNWSPRVGFSWSSKDSKTVLSGGYGIFYDALAAGLVDDLLTNPPVSVAIRVRPSAGVLPFDPGPNGGPAIWRASANAFNINQTYAQLSKTLSSLGAVFAAPSFNSITGTVHAPMVHEWNFQVQRQLSNSTALIVNYAGNHGTRFPYGNSWVNAYDAFGIYPGVPGVPDAPPVPNYGTVQQFQSGAISNYAGLSVSVRQQFGHSFIAQFNYTWSHALDEISNGGVFAFNDNSLLGQLNPAGLRANNYGNADYDIRHNFSANLVYQPKVAMSNRALNQIVNGWQFSGKIFWRSGLPFTVLDANTALGNFAGSLLGTYIGTPTAVQTTCNASAAVTPCVNASAFIDASAASFNAFTALSTQTRNQFRGPHFFDTDLAVYRNFAYRERLKFAIGLQAFNAFNHPNFGLPDNQLGSPTFGMITHMATTPTSPYGNFLGFDSSPRVAQLTAKITF